MIYDELRNWNQYFKGPVFDEIFERLQAISIDTKNGEYFKTDQYYFKVMSYETTLEPAIIESHKKEVDIQLALSGGERIRVYDTKDVEVSSGYSEEIDCMFYRANNPELIELKLIPDKMAVFFPNDIHGCQYSLTDKENNIKKIVIKINEELFTH